jgi:hypothetical protein
LAKEEFDKGKTPNINKRGQIFVLGAELYSLPKQTWSMISTHRFLGAAMPAKWPTTSARLGRGRGESSVRIHADIDGCIDNNTPASSSSSSRIVLVLQTSETVRGPASPLAVWLVFL